jgi:hypothetical protein
MVTKTIEVGKIYQLIHSKPTIFVLIVGKIKNIPTFKKYPHFQGGGNFKTLTPGSNQFKHRIMYHSDWKEFGKE